MKKTTLFTIVLVIFTLGGQAQWHWVNPLPQGNPLNDIFFADAITGYAVGNYGTIFKTTDGGNNWNLVNSGTTVDLFGVFFTSPDTGYVCGNSNYLIRKTTDGGVTWITQNSTICYALASIFFTSANVGYACGGGWLCKTINGGTTWSATSPFTYNVQKIYFTTPSTGYASGGTDVFKTTDSGVTWTVLNTGTPYGLPGICFTDTSNGYFVGALGTIRRTSNAGNSWIATNSNATANLTSVSFPNTQTGYICGSSGILLKTVDSGVTWVPLPGFTGLGVSDIHFINATTGFAISAGLIVMTTDGGLTWTPKTSGLTFYPFTSVHFSDAQTGFVGGIGLYKSTDGGATWTLNIPNEGFSSIYFANANTGYAAGMSYGDSIYKTTNAGLSWTKMGPPSFLNGQRILSMFFSSPDTGLAFSSTLNSSTVFRTINGGVSWIAVYGPFGSEEIKSVSFPDTYHGFAVGYTGSGEGFLMKTVDGGISWVISIINTNRLYGVWFADALSGYAVGAGVILKTTDGGNNWTVYNTTAWLYSVQFADVNTGYAVGEVGTIYKTVDAGNSWVQQPSPTDNGLSAIYLTHGDTGIIIGAHGTILSNDSNMIITALPSENDLPAQNVMNYPNPFSNYSAISYELSRGGNVSVEILDVSGKRVRKIFEGTQNAGAHQVFFSSDDILPGVYLYLLRTEDGLKSGKMIKLND